MPAPLFNQTRPFGEDIVFRSSTTGEHTLDAYLEDAERGGKTLGELMEIAFDPTGIPNFQIGSSDAGAAAAAASAAAAAASAASLSTAVSTAQAAQAAAAASATAAANSNLTKLDKAGDTATGPVILPFSDKQTQTITAPGTVSATAGVRYIIAANGVTLNAPASPAVNSYHGVVICHGVSGFVWNFGSVRLRGATPGSLEWNLNPQAVDLHYIDATRGYV
jgi:hypothetical protein